jgi:hypothetical protein
LFVDYAEIEVIAGREGPMEGMAAKEETSISGLRIISPPFWISVIKKPSKLPTASGVGTAIKPARAGKPFISIFRREL